MVGFMFVYAAASIAHAVSRCTTLIGRWRRRANVFSRRHYSGWLDRREAPHHSAAAPAPPTFRCHVCVCACVRTFRCHVCVRVCT